mmetsp:Transcript_11060/g.25666  ORF Transcript_11060/g.25666 Transcript_11060/m.25666 type:complete len:126 (-) Transcript_11060:685-1062(-)
MISLGARERFHEAIAIGINVLEDLGERLPTNPGPVTGFWEIMKAKWMLRGMSSDDLLRLPTLKDKKQLAAQRIMDIMVHYTFKGAPNFAPVIVGRSMQLTLKYGQSAMTATTLGLYSSIVANGLE